MDTVYLRYYILSDDKTVHSLIEKGDNEGEENKFTMV
jgi:hypothetical protein